MQAIIRDRYGSADVLRLADVNTPSIGDDEVLVRVRASSMNAGDRFVMRGEPYVMRCLLGLRRPKARGLGQDVSGTIEAVGPNVTEWQPGDEVFGEVEFGQTWAEYAVAPAEVLARKPANLSFVEAAALPVAAMTALQAVRDHGQVRPGQRVLVNGGSGSVGSYVVQLAKAAGAVVTAVCSAAHLDRAVEFGAADVIDYRSEDYTQLGRTWDVVLDVAGSRTLRENRAVLEADGTYVAIGSPVDDPWIRPLLRLAYLSIAGRLSKKQRVVVFVAKPGRESLDSLTRMIDAGDLKPAYAERCTLAEVPTMMSAVEAGHTRGKVVVAVA